MTAALSMALVGLSIGSSAHGLELSDPSAGDVGYDGITDDPDYGGITDDPGFGAPAFIEPCDPAHHPDEEADPFCNPVFSDDPATVDPGIKTDPPPVSLSFDDGSFDDGSFDDGSFDDGSFDDGSFDDGSIVGDSFDDAVPAITAERSEPASAVPLTDLDGDLAIVTAANRMLFAIDALAELDAYERATRPEVGSLIREVRETIPGDGLTSAGYVAELDQFARDFVPFLELLETSGVVVSDDLWAAVDDLEFVGLETGALDAGTTAFLQPEPWINGAGDLLVRGGESAPLTVRPGDTEAIRSAMAAFRVSAEQGTAEDDPARAVASGAGPDTAEPDAGPETTELATPTGDTDDPQEDLAPNGLWWIIGVILLVAAAIAAVLRRDRGTRSIRSSIDVTGLSSTDDQPFFRPAPGGDRLPVAGGMPPESAANGGPPSVADLLDASRRMTSSLDAASIADIALAEARRLVQAEGGIVVRRSDGGLAPVSCEPPMLFNYDHIADGCLPRVVETGRSTTSIATQEPLLVEVPMAMAAVPIVADGVVGGAILVVRVSARPFARDELDSLEMLAPLVGSAFAAADTHESATELVDVEPLTGLQNRRRLDQDLASISANEQVAYVMVDIDHFKNFNDTNGHAAGDEALRQVSALLSASVRPRDLVYRYGGEEFCVLLPGATASEAAEVAERARAAVEGADIPGMEHQPDGRITISVGVSDSAWGTPGDLVDRADAALYEAKRNGRNQVSLHQA